MLGAEQQVLGCTATQAPFSPHSLPSAATHEFYFGAARTKRGFQHFHRPSRENFSSALFNNNEKPSKKPRRDFSGSITNQERCRSCSYLVLTGGRGS